MGGVSVKQMEYNTRPFFEQCVDRYLTPTKNIIDTLQPAQIPFLDESDVGNTASDSKEGLLAPVACKVLMKNYVWSSSCKFGFAPTYCCFSYQDYQVGYSLR